MYPPCVHNSILVDYFYFLAHSSSGRTDRTMCMEQSKRGPNNLKSCPSCSFAFFCCAEHWTAVEPKHSVMPHDSPDTGPAVPERSQCAINREIQVDTRFSECMSGAKVGEFRWAPERTLPQWMTLEGKGMGAEFGVPLGKEQRIPESVLVPWMRAASDGLSMPMTILWALEKLHGADESWTRKGVLTVHVSRLSCFLAAINPFSDFGRLPAGSHEIGCLGRDSSSTARGERAQRMQVLHVFAFLLINGDEKGRFVRPRVGEFHDGAGRRH